MEPLAMEKVKRTKAKGRGPTIGARRGPLPIAYCLLPFVLCLAGCVNTGAFVLPGVEKLGAAPCEVVVAWNPEVLFRPDPAHRGTPTPGLGGRMYLFTAGNNCPITGDGCMVVDLYEDLSPNATVPLEEWRFDKDTLKRLLRRDAVGWGYTLFLPWGTYKPEIKQVQLRLRYEPVKGAPLYAESSSVVFQKGNAAAPALASHSTNKPGSPVSGVASARTQPGSLRQAAATSP